MSLEMLQKMKEAGCVHIGFGVESGSKQILENINKKITISQIKNAFALAKKTGLRTKAFFMIGNIGENSETIKETKKLLLEIMPDQMSISRSVMIFPGTPLYYKVKREGRLDDSVWINDDKIVYDFENSKEQMQRWQMGIMWMFHRKKGIVSFFLFAIQYLRVLPFKELLKYLYLFVGKKEATGKKC